MQRNLLLAVVVWSGMVAVEYDGERHVLTGGESRTFAQEREKKGDRRPEGRGLRALVDTVADGKLTITTRGDAGVRTTTLDVPSSAKILIDGKAAKLADLAKGTVVIVERNEKNELLSVRAEGPTVAGLVKDASLEKITLEMRRREGQPGETTTYALSKDTKVNINGKAGKADDVKSGQNAIVVLTTDKKTAVSISIGRGRDGEREKGGRVQRLAGEVKSVDTKEGKIILAARGEAGERAMKVAKDAKVTIDGKEAKLADVKTGVRVLLTMDKDGNSVSAVDVGTRRRGEGDKERD